MPSAHFRVLPPPSSSSKVDDEDDRGSKSLKYNGQKLLISGNGAPNSNSTTVCCLSIVDTVKINPINHRQCATWAQSLLCLSVCLPVGLEGANGRGASLLFSLILILAPLSGQKGELSAEEKILSQ